MQPTSTGGHDPNGATARVERFYRRDHDKLWRSLLAYTGDPDLASEAESEALTQALRRGADIDDPAAWIWRTSYNVAAGLLKSRRRRATAVERLPEQPVMDELLIDTLSLLDGLAPQQRAIVALRYLANLKPTAIAEVLGTTPGTVRAQLHRANTTLRQTWSDDQ